MKRLYIFTALLAVCIFSFTNPVKSQLVVDNSIDVATMLHDFFDNTCVTIDNITYNGVPVAVGFFEASGTNLGIDAGIMMTSGDITNAIGPNNNESITTINTVDGDADLTALSGYTTYDACVIEMDVIPSLDTLYFEYVFGSDEYSEWVGTSFNDVFAFYVSGPGIAGTQNIAMVPGTGAPVSVNSINCTSNQDYYVCNSNLNTCFGFPGCPDDNDNTTLEYDGFTVPVTAQITVIPGETYHVKLAIADAADGVLDSGIFIGVQSLCGDGHLKPFADFDSEVTDQLVQFQNLSKYATSYNWDFGDGTFSTEENPSHEYAEDGTYYVTLSTNNYCCDMSVTHPVSIGMATGISSIENGHLKIFPNPTSDVLHIELGNGQEGVVKLYDHTGKELTSFTMHGSANVDLSGYEKGMLFMQVIADGKVYMEKVGLN